MNNFRHTALAASCALMISATCILGAVGPVRAAVPIHQNQPQIGHVDARQAADSAHR